LLCTNQADIAMLVRLIMFGNKVPP